MVAASSCGGSAAPCASGLGLAPRSPSPHAQPRAGGSSAFYWCPQLPPGGRQLFFFGLASTLRTSLCSAAPSERSGALNPPPPGRARAAARSAAPPSPPSPGGCCRRDAWAAAGGEEKAPETGPGGCPTHPPAPPQAMPAPTRRFSGTPRTTSWWRLPLPKCWAMASPLRQ